MAKKITRRFNGLFWVDSTTGTETDLPKYVKRLYDSNRNETDRFSSEERLKELDQKYDEVLRTIVDKRK